jgi:LacI family transcriptional regulator
MNIGIVIPEFIGSFFPEVIIGAQEVLFKQGYQALITQSNECCKTEIENVKLLEKNMVDGLIISLTHETEDIGYFKELISSGLPIVFLIGSANSLKHQRCCSMIINGRFLQQNILYIKTIKKYFI